MSNRKHSGTSTAAHESIKPAKSFYHEKIIEGLTNLRVGATTHELAACLMIQNAQVHKRMSELQRDGIIYNTGITRPSPSGRACSVWQLVDIVDVLKNKKESAIIKRKIINTNSVYQQPLL